MYAKVSICLDCTLTYRTRSCRRGRALLKGGAPARPDRHHRVNPALRRKRVAQYQSPADGGMAQGGAHRARIRDPRDDRDSAPRTGDCVHAILRPAEIGSPTGRCHRRHAPTAQSVDVELLPSPRRYRDHLITPCAGACDAPSSVSASRSRRSGARNYSGITCVAPPARQSQARCGVQYHHGDEEPRSIVAASHGLRTRSFRDRKTCEARSDTLGAAIIVEVFGTWAR